MAVSEKIRTILSVSLVPATELKTPSKVVRERIATETLGLPILNTAVGIEAMTGGHPAVWTGTVDPAQGLLSIHGSFGATGAYELGCFYQRATNISPRSNYLKGKFEKTALKLPFGKKVLVHINHTYVLKIDPYLPAHASISLPGKTRITNLDLAHTIYQLTRNTVRSAKTIQKIESKRTR